MFSSLIGSSEGRTDVWGLFYLKSCYNWRPFWDELPCMELLLENILSVGGSSLKSMILTNFRALWLTELLQVTGLKHRLVWKISEVFGNMIHILQCIMIQNDLVWQHNEKGTFSKVFVSGVIFIFCTRGLCRRQYAASVLDIASE